MEHQDLIFPSGRNIRPLVFLNHIKGYGIMPGTIYDTYPWLTNCKYKILKEVFTPNGDFYEVGVKPEHEPKPHDIPYKKIPRGTLTIIIEIFNENQPSPE